MRSAIVHVLSAILAVSLRGDQSRTELLEIVVTEAGQFRERPHNSNAGLPGGFTSGIVAVLRRSVLPNAFARSAYHRYGNQKSMVSIDVLLNASLMFGRS